MVNLSEEKELLVKKCIETAGKEGPELFVTIDGCDLDALDKEGLGDVTSSEGSGTYIYNEGTVEEPDLRIATYACYDPEITVEELREMVAEGVILTDRDEMIAYLKEKGMSYYDEKLDKYIDNEN